MSNPFESPRIENYAPNGGPARCHVTILGSVKPEGANSISITERNYGPFKSLGIAIPEEDTWLELNSEQAQHMGQMLLDFAERQRVTREKTPLVNDA